VVDSIESSIVGTTVQFSGTVLVTLLCGILLRTVRRRFLTYWAAGWCCMALALMGLLIGFTVPHGRVIGHAVYCFAEYAAGFLWVAGCRCLAADYRLTRRNYFWCVPAALIAIALPWAAGEINGLMVVHALLMACFFATGFAVLYATRGTARGAGTGVMMAALFLLAVDFLQYAPVCAYSYLTGVADPLPYMKYSALYDLMLEMLLAFGMVMVVMEHVRQELEAANHELRATGSRLKQMAQCDPLTGALNRHAFDSLMSEARDNGCPFAGCVALLDIDNLKPINDTLGHAAGDRAIQLVARTVRSAIRPDDFLFRWGGDEFLVLWLGQIKEADAALRLERLNEELARNARADGQSYSQEASVSFGLATFSDLAGVLAAIHRADERMYTRKLSRPGRLRRTAVAGS
jgi:diguanylate cyclase (GGDEF)-like protein